jgi:RsiW-degrading membrane proteinase PrsW (M82 family)
MSVTSLGLATILAALVVPALSAAYIRRADVQGNVPVLALVATAAIGGLAGVGLALLSRRYLDQLTVVQLVGMAQGRPPVSLLLLLGVSLPLAGELLKQAGPLLLRRWPRMRNRVMDGVVLGVASGAGFAASSTLVNYWPIIRDGYAPTGATGTSEWIATLAGLAVLRPLIQVTTTGLIAAGVWTALLGRRRVMLPVVVGLGGAVAYSLGELLLLGRGTLAVLTLHGMLAAVLLMSLRRTIREALLLDAWASRGGWACGTLSGCDE